MFSSECRASSLSRLGLVLTLSHDMLLPPSGRNGCTLCVVLRHACQSQLPPSPRCSAGHLCRTPDLGLEVHHLIPGLSLTVQLVRQQKSAAETVRRIARVCIAQVSVGYSAGDSHRDCLATSNCDLRAPGSSTRRCMTKAFPQNNLAGMLSRRRSGRSPARRNSWPLHLRRSRL